jgi:hypothetical protein
MTRKVGNYVTCPKSRREHFLTAKRGEAELISERRWTFLSGRSAQDANPSDRMHLLLGRNSGWSVVLLPGAFLLICGSAFHGVAHNAFMALPPYTRTREGETPQLGSGSTPCRLGFGVRKCSLMELYGSRQEK